MTSGTSARLSPAVPRSATEEDDLISVAAFGVLAFISADLAHEVVGHGIGLLIAGGRSGILTTTRLIYESQLPSPNWRIFDIGGPAGNLIWAGICFLAQRSIRRTIPGPRLFLWTSMSFSLFWEFGYLMKCGVTGHGDGMALIEGFTPAWLWRALLFIIGLVLYRGAMSLSSSELHFVLSAATPQWRSRLVRLLLTLCIAGGLIACAGPIFDPRGRIEMLNSGALSGFASWVGLFAVPSLFPLHADQKLVAVTPVRRSIPVIVLAATASVLFVAILGQGIRWTL
jgi:hypothetical protein